MKKRAIILGFLVLLTFIFSKTAAEAAFLSLDPSSKASPLGTTFEVKINIDTEGERVTSADAILLFDGNFLEATGIQEGDGTNEPFFPDLFKNISPNEIYVGAAVRNPTEIREGRGTIALITFRGKAEGATDVKFDCTFGKTSDSNISKNDKNATDIIECGRNVNGRYTIGTGVGGPTSTPSYPTSIIYPTSTPAPTIPVAGSSDATIGLLGIGALLTVVGIAGKIIFKL